jgi:hypothetical protein
MILTPEAEAVWREDGWCVLPAAIPAEDLAGAQRALAHLFPSVEEMDARLDAGNDDERTGPWRDWDVAKPEFPFRSRSLNKVAMHQVCIDLAERLLDSRDIRLYQGVVSAKYAGQSSGFNQLLHTDYPNHTLVVPRRDTGYQHLELFVYLNDVTVGATRLVSWRKTADIPVERHTLSLADYGPLYDVPGEATGPAGSIVAYRPDVYHRSVDFTERGIARFMMHLAYRPANAAWVGFHTWPSKGLSPDFSNFVQQATPRQLALLGFPEPGHPYWTDETLAGVSARYPSLDMAPWQTARTTQP